MDATATPWFDEELAGCSLADKRLGWRLRQLVERMGGSIGASIPLACQDWANTKAAYRFFSNDRVGEADILAGHFQSPVAVSLQRLVPSWSCRTRWNSPINGKAPMRLA